MKLRHHHHHHHDERCRSISTTTSTRSMKCIMRAFVHVTSSIVHANNCVSQKGSLSYTFCKAISRVLTCTVKLLCDSAAQLLRNNPMWDLTTAPCSVVAGGMSHIPNVIETAGSEISQRRSLRFCTAEYKCCTRMDKK